MVPEQGDDGMGMQIASNVIAISTLNGLEKNRKKQSKALNQAASGTRINYAGDDASGYAISERMRVQIRSLNQDVENVKTGKDLLHTAEGGVQSIVNELRNLKAMALDSANDTNTDVDRATIQKEFSSRMEEINDIAATTNYNGKILLDGRYGELGCGVQKQQFGVNSNGIISSKTTLQGVQTLLTKTVAVSLAASSNSTIVYDPNSPFKYNDKISGLFPVATGNHALSSLGGITGYSPYGRLSIAEDSSWKDAAGNPFAKLDIYDSVSSEGTIPSDPPKSYWLNSSKGKVLTKKELVNVLGDTATIKGANAIRGIKEGGTGIISKNEVTQAIELIDYTASIVPGSGNTVEKLDFSGMIGTLPTDLDNQGFTLLCAACYQDIAVKFDANLAQGNGELLTGSAIRPDPVNHNKSVTVDTYAYVVGVKGVADGKGLEAAVFNGMAVAQGGAKTDDFGNSYVTMAARHDVRITKIGDAYYLSKDSVRMVIVEGFEGKLTGGSTPATGGELTPTDPGGGTTPVDPGGGTGPVPSGGGEAGDVITDNAQMESGSLIIHTGTKANQHLRLFLNDMHTSAMGLDDAGVDPLERALKSIGMLDTAIDYALNESTRVGAYISRLDATQDNLTTAHENVTHAESVIRDADMAKTMTEYAKDGILSQAAQAMLSQANQQGHAVLNLLQG